MRLVELSELLINRANVIFIGFHRATHYNPPIMSELKHLDERFLNYLEKHDVRLYSQLLNYRAGLITDPKVVSQWIIDCALVLEDFVAELFNIQRAAQALRALTIADDPVFAFKEYFVLREAKRRLRNPNQDINFNELDQWITDQIKIFNLNDHDRELAVAMLGQRWLSEQENHLENLNRLTDWCVAAMLTEVGQQAVAGWSSFHLPHKRDHEHLVPPTEHYRERDGFGLTDARMTRREAMSEVHYCVYCHEQDGDFCSKGFPVKKSDPSQGIKVNSLGDTLTGCPLEEKISEMHFLKKMGCSIGALATVMIDNPMCPVTGHRICNDCMKACIYQKQDPVNIPQVETRVLIDVLELPWGVEIYDLLTRWNPLRSTQYIAKPWNGLKVLVMGMGPAGFTLAHHLLMEGFAVVGCDGLKIEPLPKALLEKPIYRYADLTEALDERIMGGFGGVAEYGITVRWDKNFLKLIYITLMRRPHFQVFGGVRFGGTLKVDDVWGLGFDHLALAVGAGLPRELNIEHSLAPGMRQANDFLMALQLTGAAKKTSLANLQIRLPAVVIGGGLTGVDAATEAQAYYITQVEKTAKRYEILCDRFGKNNVRSRFKEEQLEVLDEFLKHGEAVIQERQRAAVEKRTPHFLALLREWGGVTIAYRRHMQDSPAYRRNHEELVKALEEGIYYAEGLNPTKVLLDEVGRVSALCCKTESGEERILPAKSIFVATGAKPNIAYEYEYRGTFERDAEKINYRRFNLIEGKLTPAGEKIHVKMDEFGPFTSYERDHHRVTFLGDTHPVFHGSVVNAVASAKRSYPFIVTALQKQFHSNVNLAEYASFREKIQDLFSATVTKIERWDQDLLLLTVRAPLAARHFQPGQFYRLQNYESLAPVVDNTRLQTEAVALLGMRDEKDPDSLQFIIQEVGVSTRLISTFTVGMPVALMGPSGVRAKIPESPQTLLFIGGVMAAIHLCAQAPDLKAHGHRLAFVATEVINPRLRDRVLKYVDDYVDGLDQVVSLKLDTIQTIMVIGSSELLQSVQCARQGIWKDKLPTQATFIGSVYGPMQCMLKGVCAQCLQWQVDPKTGQRTKAVYACSWHDQPLEKVDISHIDERLSQNSLQEGLSHLWLNYLFEGYSVERV